MKKQVVKQWLSERKSAWLIVLVPVFIACFFIVEGRPLEGYWVSYLPLDDKIPFLPPFVLFYYMWFPFMVVTGWKALLAGNRPFIRFFAFLMGGFLLCLGICLLFPNGQELRPTGFSEDTVFTRLIAAIYAVDTNTNVLPSMHVVGCMAGVFSAFDVQWKKNRLARGIVILLAILICASTVFIKQHSILDIFAALGLCALLWPMIFGKSTAERRKGIHS